MNCNLSRSQKARANKRQKSILDVIAEQSKLQHKYGDYYIWLNFVNELEKRGIVLFCDKEQRAEFLGMCLLGEYLRRIAINNPTLFSHTDIPKEYNTDNLYIGQVVPNYKELCRLLEVKPKTGKSRQLQEKDFLRYFDYEKIKYSNEYLILDIYDEPIKKNEQAKNSLYCNALKLMIMYELSKELSAKKANERLQLNDDDIVYSIKTTYNNLVKKLKLLSIFFDKDITDYLIDKYLQLTDQDITDIDKSYIIRNLSIYKRVINRKHKGNIDYALKCLKNQNIIHFDSYSVIVEKVDGRQKKRQATFDEEVLIENAKREAAKEVGYKNANIASLYNPKAYHDKLDELYHKKGWLYVYHEIEYGANSKMINTPINEYTNYSILDFSVLDLSDNERERYKQIYIDNMGISSLKKAENDHSIAKQQIQEDKAVIKSGDNQYTYSELDECFGITPDSFLQNIDNAFILQKLFIDYFINPDDKEIAECNDYYET